MLDMSRRMAWVEALVVVILITFAVLSIPSCGWALLVASVLVTFVYLALRLRMPRHRRPEYLFVRTFAIAQLLLAAAIVASNGRQILLLPLLAGPALITSAVWPLRGAVVAAIGSAALMALVAFLVAPSAVVHTPALLIEPLAVLTSLAIIAAAAQGADIASRATAVVDRLTGLLNRPALLSRVAELTHQSGYTGESVAVIVADVDNFKQVNDRHGHARGDEVLAGIAARLRRPLGPAESVYRFGGEEFVILAPGADAAAGAVIAEAIREEVRREEIDGLPITLSVGVAASLPHEPFDFEALFNSADAALYAAKGQGRDRVCFIDRGDSTAAGSVPAAAMRMTSIPERRASRQTAIDDAPESVLPDQSGTGSVEERLARYQAESRSWLIRDDAARAHMIDMMMRLRRERTLIYGVIFIGLLAAGPSYGWLPVVPPLLGVILLSVAMTRSVRGRRPEWASGGAILAWLPVNAAGFLFAHGSPYCALPLLVVPVFAWSPAFPPRGVAIAAVIEAALIVAAAAVIGGHDAFSDPVPVGIPLALLATATLIGSVLGKSAIDHRSASIVDQLTGLLTRHALESRIAEIGYRVVHTQEPVAVVIGDIDSFKQVNDRHGHRTGDVVLREIAYRIRTNLRAFESAYRIGGEEFVVLLTGVRAQDAAEIAERLRKAVRKDSVDGLSVTMSFGVAASAQGQPFDYAALFERADAGLYQAKVSGRDRVCFVPGDGPPTSDPGAPVEIAA